MNNKFALILTTLVVLAASNAIELKKILRKPHEKAARPSTSPAQELNTESFNDCKNETISAEEIRQMIQDEIIAYNADQIPRASALQFTNDSESYRSTRIVLIDAQGRRFDYDENEATYRDIPSSMCSASALSASTPANQAAFVTAHNSLRSQLHSCTWKVPKPNAPLPSTTSSKEMAASADSYTQYLKTNQNCGLVHSSQAQRTQTFKLDDGTHVTNGYIGENLAWLSLCLSIGDTGSFNKYQAQYCAPGYLYTNAANSWWSEIAAYSAANNGKFLTQEQLDAAHKSGQVGHWTQMCWGDSTTIAGAAAECVSTSPQTFGCAPKGVGGCSAAGTITVNSRCYSWVVTGRYWKGGNYQGQNPYASDGTICSPGSG